MERRVQLLRQVKSMRILTLTSTFFFALFAAGCERDKSMRSGAERIDQAPGATAELKNAQGNTVGNATFTETPDGVNIAVQVRGISPGQHGLHLHETGKCEAPDFKPAGQHFNPARGHHGGVNTPVRHAGDLGNIEVAASGVGTVQQTVKGVTLKKGDHSLLRDEGTSIVLHGGPDDLKSDPAGNSGDRIACGVVTRD
jgi:Cu-Zn family superoxide dismutase